MSNGAKALAERLAEVWPKHTEGTGSFPSSPTDRSYQVLDPWLAGPPDALADAILANGAMFLTAEHREAIWDEGGFHPGYGKGVCEFDGNPWPCKHWTAHSPETVNGPQQARGREGRATPDSGPDRSSPQAYPEGSVVRAEDMGLVERAYAEAMHEDCEDGPPHPLTAHSPWSGGDLEGTEPWPAFMARLARHGLTLAATAEPAPDVDEIAAWLLRVGYGTDFRYVDDDGQPDLPPVPVLEAMVRLGALDGGMVQDQDREAMYFVLSEELGDWRAALHPADSSRREP